jgi:hypothetical protein
MMVILIEKQFVTVLVLHSHKLLKISSKIHNELVQLMYDHKKEG